MTMIQNYGRTLVDLCKRYLCKDPLQKDGHWFVVSWETTERRKIYFEFHKEQSCQECPSLMSVLDYERTVTDVFLFY